MKQFDKGGGSSGLGAIDAHRRACSPVGIAVWPHAPLPVAATRQRVRERTRCRTCRGPYRAFGPNLFPLHRTNSSSRDGSVPAERVLVPVPRPLVALLRGWREALEARVGISSYPLRPE